LESVNGWVRRAESGHWEEMGAVVRDRELLPVDTDTASVWANKCVMSYKAKRLREREHKEDVYCICRGPEVGFMVCCDLCGEWFHGACVASNPAIDWDGVDIYVCIDCSESKERGSYVYR
jgi:hypothetical protein